MSADKVTDYVVEPFNGEDDQSSEIAAIHLAIRRWQEEIGQNNFIDLYDSQPDLNDIEGFYVNRGGNFFDAKDSSTGKVIGFVALKNDGEGTGVIKRLAVLPERHRQGVATALMEMAINWARTSNSFSKIRLTTGKDEMGRPLYEQLGFEVVGFDEEHQDWFMVLDLEPNGQAVE